MNRKNLFCPVCGSDDAVVVDRRMLKTGLHQSWLCGCCGMVFVYPRKPLATYLRFYRGDYTSRVYGLEDKQEAVEEVLKWRRRRSLEKIGYFPRFWKGKLQVLEIGAGIGAFLDVLRDRHQARVWGIEPSPAFVNAARTYLQLPIFHGSFEEWTKKKGDRFPKQYDRIVMDQILEHMLDPVAFLSSLHAHLKKDGQIFISVPNVAEPKEPRKDFFIFEHVSSFSPFSLTLLLARCGYKVTGIFAEQPGSLQVTAAPFSSRVKMVQPEIIGSPVTAKMVKKRFARL